MIEQWTNSGNEALITDNTTHLTIFGGISFRMRNARVLSSCGGLTSSLVCSYHRKCLPEQSLLLMMIQIPFGSYRNQWAALTIITACRNFEGNRTKVECFRELLRHKTTSAIITKLKSLTVHVTPVSVYIYTLYYYLHNIYCCGNFSRNVTLVLGMTATLSLYTALTLPNYA